MTRQSSPVLLLVENRDGATVGIRFPSAEAASEWDYAHEDEGVFTVGTVPIVTAAQVLRELRPRA